MAGWQHKALREARRLSGWLEPNEDYEAAAATFLGRLLDLEFSTVFLQRLHRQVQELAAAGAVNSLAQTLLQYTAPGVPDLYQGTELWDFSLVDPDNRAAVDLAPRRAALAEPASLTALRERWREGGIKLRLIHGLLSLRRDHPDLFEHGSHVLLPASGPAAARMMLIHRHHGARHLLAAVPRGVAGWVTEALEIPPGHWQGSELELPAELAGLWGCGFPASEQWSLSHLETDLNQPYISLFYMLFSMNQQGRSAGSTARCAGCTRRWSDRWKRRRCGPY